MDRLPPELKGPIIRLAIESLPEGENRAQYATVCREWREHAELVLFETLNLDLCRLSEAHRFMTSKRLTYVRQINLKVFLPETPDAWAESERSRTNNKNEGLYLQLSGILGHLSQLKITNRNVVLSLAVRISEEDAYDEAHLFNRFPSVISLPRKTYRKLPQVNFVTRFEYCSTNSRTSWLLPKTCCEIATRFPCLRSVKWNLSEMKAFGQVPGGRAELAAALALVPKSVRDFNLHYDYMGKLVWFYSFVDTIPADTLDPLSLALRQLSKQLEKVTLTMSIGSEFFSGPDHDDDEDTPLWPYMREVKINANPETLQGTMFFNILVFRRCFAYHGELNKLHLASGLAAAHMPNLEHLSIKWQPSVGWTYTRRRHERGARLTATEVEPSGLPHDIEEAWCTAAGVHLGAEGKLRFDVTLNQEEVDYQPQEMLNMTEDHNNPPAGSIKWTRTV